jgi:hypothetical protein
MFYWSSSNHSKVMIELEHPEGPWSPPSSPSKQSSPRLSRAERLSQPHRGTRNLYREIVTAVGCLVILSVQLYMSLSTTNTMIMTASSRPAGAPEGGATNKALRLAAFRLGRSQDAVVSKSPAQEAEQEPPVPAVENEPPAVEEESQASVVEPSLPVPSCLCPFTCDESALSRRLISGGGDGSSNISCLERIHQLLGERREVMSCMKAVEDGFCGDECHPNRCTPRVEGAEPESQGPSKVVPDWSSIQSLELPKEAFKRYENVVVVTKVVGPKVLDELKQMLCLFTAAYNRHVKYDIVVFTTRTWNPDQIQELQSVAPDVNLTVEVEAPPLDQQVEDMSPEEREYLYRRCRIEPGERLTYDHWCTEEPGNATAPTNVTTDYDRYDVKLSYAWQAEFRARHVWHAPALAPYRYMLWIDSDAFCTQPWESDPVEAVVENELVLLFDHWPGDFVVNPVIYEKIATAYDNRTICDIRLEDGRLSKRPCGEDDANSLGVVHGFFHVTDLDFYRSQSVTRFLDVMIGGKRFSREWDDQLAVTIPAVMEAPDRSWDMRSRGINLQVWHNGYLDGQDDERPRPADDDFLPWWGEVGRDKWDVGRNVCGTLVTSNG